MKTNIFETLWKEGIYKNLPLALFSMRFIDVPKVLPQFDFFITPYNTVLFAFKYFFIQKSGRTPLMAAAGSGGTSVINALLEARANVNALDAKKNCAGHLAALAGQLQAIKLMAGYNADFNVIASDGGNPIHYAAQKGHAMCIKFLSQRGQCIKYCLSTLTF